MKKVTLLSCALLLVVFFSGAAFSQAMKKEAIKPFNDGLVKSQKGDYKAAVADFDTALKFDKDYRIYYQLAFAQMRLKDNDNAIANFKEAVKLNPKLAAAYSDMGSVYFSSGKYDDAIQNFQKAMDNDTTEQTKTAAKFNLALSYTNLATAAENGKNYKKAISDLKKAVSYSNYDGAYLALARNYVMASEYSSAIGAAEKALKYRKAISEAGPYYYMGVAYSQKGDMKKAKEYLNKAKTDPVYKSVAETVLKAIK